MATITISNELIKKEKELVLIPRKAYEEFLALKKMIKIVKPTKIELRAIERGKKEIKKGKYILWHEFKQELARHNR